MPVRAGQGRPCRDGLTGPAGPAATREVVDGGEHAPARSWGATPVSRAGRVTAPGPLLDLRAARRRLLLDGAGITLRSSGSALVYGLAARSAGLHSLVDAMAMSLVVFAGASQFTAVGYVAAGLPWLPYRRADVPAQPAAPPVQRRLSRRASGEVPFRPAGRDGSRAHGRGVRARRPRTSSGSAGSTCPGTGSRPSWLVFIPWNLATIVGGPGRQRDPGPGTTLGLDVVFPAAMAGLAVGARHGTAGAGRGRCGRRRSGSSSSLAAGTGDRDHRGRPAGAAARHGGARRAAGASPATPSSRAGRSTTEARAGPEGLEGAPRARRRPVEARVEPYGS